MIYESARGSTVTRLPGKGASIEFDWFEEEVCVEADVWFEEGPPAAIHAACGCADCLDGTRDAGEYWTIEVTPKVIDGLAMLAHEEKTCSCRDCLAFRKEKKP